MHLACLINLNNNLLKIWLIIYYHKSILFYNFEIYKLYLEFFQNNYKISKMSSQNPYFIEWHILYLN